MFGFFKIFSNFFTNDIAIDFGTTNTRIFVKDKGILVNEPTLLSIKDIEGDKKIIAFGEESKKMLGRTSKELVTVKPIKNGFIVELSTTTKLVEYFFNKVHEKRFFKPNPRVLACIPYGASEVDKKALEDVLLQAGARAVYFIDNPLANALGAGVNLRDKGSHMIINIGGGLTEISVLSFGEVVVSHSIKIGGEKFDNDIISYIRKEHGCSIGAETAEKLKRLSTDILYPENKEVDDLSYMNVNALDISLNVPVKIKVTKKDIYFALYKSIETILEAIMTVLEETPAEVVSEVMDGSIIMTGGGANLKNLDALIKKATTIDTVIVKEPMFTAINGAGKALCLLNEKESKFFGEE